MSCRTLIRSDVGVISCILHYSLKWSLASLIKWWLNYAPTVQGDLEKRWISHTFSLERWCLLVSEGVRHPGYISVCATLAVRRRPEVHAAFTNAGRESPAFPVNQICLGYITLDGVGLASREIRPCWALAQASTDHCFSSIRLTDGHPHDEEKQKPGQQSEQPGRPCFLFFMTLKHPLTANSGI